MPLARRPTGDETSVPGLSPGRLVGLAVEPRVGVGLAVAGSPDPAVAAGDDDGELGWIASLELVHGPRWVMWSNTTAKVLVERGIRVARSWDIAAVHRLLYGGWRADPALVWARLHDLPVHTIPTEAPIDLFHQETVDETPDEPVGADGHLKPGWLSGGWCATPDRLARWAELALEVAGLQQDRLAALDRPARAAATARSESAAELLCAELSVDGLPMDRAATEAFLTELIGPRPRTDAEADSERARRDAEVLRWAPGGVHVDLRSTGQVKGLLGQIGVDLPDTRAWRLRALQGTHPLIDALLAWRKAERIATTYGYAWLDEHVGPDGRLRGEWSGSDGAAGRMTASAGLHNMPSEMRHGVIAEAGHLFVRADLGQIEPRVLAAISGDAALARATWEDDMYAPVARELDVDRPTAKVAVLGAMYGQTTGNGARALHRLQASYPAAMAHLEAADLAGQVSRDLRTDGGRLIPMAWTNANDVSERDARARAAARGRYGRNAMVQGAAAELFKIWAVTVRARIAPLGATIVLCLHDELLVHAPADVAHEVAARLDACLQEAAHRWAPDGDVRFVADIGVISRWSEAKDDPPAVGEALP